VIKVNSKEQAKTTLALFDGLSKRIRGDICTDILHRYILGTDASIYRKIPTAVIYPKQTEDVEQIVCFANKHKLSIHARGAGSGLCGAAIGDGIVVDFTRYMNRVLDVDLKQGWFECEPGYRKGELDAAIEGSGLFFPPDPSSGEYATFGGMYATNASGAHSAKYGNVADYLLDAQIVFSDGKAQSLRRIANTDIAKLTLKQRQLCELYNDNSETIESAYPPIQCNVAGYNLRGLVIHHRLDLRKLFAGSEGTLGIVTKLKFRLVPKPPFNSLVIAYFKDITSAALAVQSIMPMGPSGIEIMDKNLLDLSRSKDGRLRSSIPADVDNILLIEFEGSEISECRDCANGVKRLLTKTGLSAESYMATTDEEQQKFWAIRKAAVPILYKLKGRKKIIAIVEDAAVPVNRLVDFFNGLDVIFHEYKVKFVIYGHISKGLLHTRPLLDLKDTNDIRLLRILADRVFKLVNGLNGTVSGEHGDGRIRTAYVKKAFPRIFALFLKTKNLLDPNLLFNPDIKIKDDPDQMGKDLRFGSDYKAMELPQLQLIWKEGISKEIEKCHGCSKCTTTTNETRMCPVYKFTRDESASPKAKANVLRGLISGDFSDSLSYAKAFYRVMQLCVNCGSCQLECPSNVNIPKLAMEAKARYVKRNAAPIADLVTGNVGPFARLLHHFAPFANPVTRLPVIKKTIQRVTGLSQERDLALLNRKALASMTPRIIEGSSQGHVLYFAGCFGAYMRPEVGQSAVLTLNRLGYTVHVPPQRCCGLPAISKGMTERAKQQIKQNLNLWHHLIDRVDFITVTCSTCGYALMNDWRYLFDNDSVKKVAEKTVHISELMLHHELSFAYHLPAMTLAYHHPCHLRLQKEKHSSIELLNKVPNLALIDLKSHCCGMSGSWGLIAKNFELSRRIGDQLINRVNTSGADLTITDCPMCEMQISQFGSLPVRHPVEIIWQSLQKQTLH
jgi:FAD/FMN-containing dehydrogenase/Fe-S oxidoreductase